MMKLRRAEPGDMQAIIRTANAAFRTVREESFDFAKIMPKAYGEGKDTSGIHYVITEGDEIISLAGNMPAVMPVGGNEYGYTIVGTVSTLPEHQNKGCMKLLMQQIDADNRRNGVVFSALTGLRKRYNNYGFEKCMTSYKYVISKHCLKGVDVNENLTVEKFTEAELAAVYSLYLRTQPAPTRTREQMVDYLSFSEAEIFVVKQEGCTVGYFDFAQRKNCIFEMGIADIALLPAVLAQFIRETQLKQVFVSVNPLNQRLADALDAFAEGKVLTDEIHIKVYDTVRFIRMLVEFNLPYMHVTDFEETFCVNGERIRIGFDKGEVTVERVDGECPQSYDVGYFVRSVLCDGNNDVCRGSRIFPLLFGINDADMF